MEPEPGSMSSGEAQASSPIESRSVTASAATRAERPPRAGPEDEREEIRVRQR
jgi:hypothetical protein